MTVKEIDPNYGMCKDCKEKFVMNGEMINLNDMCTECRDYNISIILYQKEGLNEPKTTNDKQQTT